MWLLGNRCGIDMDVVIGGCQKLHNLVGGIDGIGGSKVRHWLPIGRKGQRSTKGNDRWEVALGFSPTCTPFQCKKKKI